MTDESDVAVEVPIVDGTEDNLSTTVTAIDKLLQPAKRGRTGESNAGFPCFDPDHSRVDVNRWCSDIDIRAEGDGVQCFDIIPRVRAALMGGAKEWYESGTGVVGQLRAVVNVGSNEFDTCTDFVMEETSRINRLPFEVPEEKIVKIVVGCVADVNLRNSLAFNMPASVQILIDNLSTVREGPNRGMDQTRRFTSGECPVPPYRSKRPRLSDDKRCFDCGGVGRIRATCPENPLRSRQVPLILDKRREVERGTNECSFCEKGGHGESTCWAKKGAEGGKVNVCGSSDVPENKTPVVVRGGLFHALLDTGSGISLIRYDMARLITSMGRTNLMTVEGIGAGPILLTESLDALMEFEQLSIEVELHVIDGSLMKGEIMVGGDVLRDPTLSIVAGSSGSALCRKPIVAESFVVEGALNEETYAEQQLRNILDKYTLYFINGFPTREVKAGSLHIRLSQDSNVNCGPYRMAMSEREVTSQIISGLMENGIVRESRSPFSSPVVLVEKRSGQNRLCVDYRALGEVTVKDRCPLPRVDDQLDMLAGNTCFSALDMASGFHQMPIAVGSVEGTAFVTPDGHYEYIRMPFGLCGAPAVFQRAINIALGRLGNREALVYMDDVIVPSRTKEEGLEKLDRVLHALTRGGFSLNVQGCKFLQTKIECLGREVTAEGVRPGPNKVDALVASPGPTGVGRVRQFMGLANCFRRFIPEFAAKTACITTRTRGNIEFVWNTECGAAKRYIIDVLTSRPLLVLFGVNQPTELHTDASAIGFGAMLFQRIQGQLGVVAYCGQAASACESGYHGCELGTLAVVDAIKHFRHYLLGIKFVLATDCNALEATKQRKDLLPRVARWWIYLQDFDFEIVCKEGVSLQHVDCLTRGITTGHCCQVDALAETWLHVEQKSDVACNEIIDKLQNGDSDAGAQYKLKSGLLYKNDDGLLKVFVPKSCGLTLIRQRHDDGCHVGWGRALHKMREHFWMPGMTGNVREFVEKLLNVSSGRAPKW